MLIYEHISKLMQNRIVCIVYSVDMIQIGDLHRFCHPRDRIHKTVVKPVRHWLYGRSTACFVTEVNTQNTMNTIISKNYKEKTH